MRKIKGMKTMINKRNKSTLYIFCVILTLSTVCGCSPRNSKMNYKSDQTGNNAKMERGTGRFQDNEKAELISHSLTGNANIRNVIVVVYGRSALIGAEIKDNNPEKLAELKKVCYEAVKQTDKNIDNIEVTTRPYLINRIMKLNYDIKNGNPIRGILSEFKNIFSE